MNRDQRMFMVALGQGTPWDTLMAHLEATCFPRRRERYGRYSSASAMFSIALADPDDRITIEIRKKRLRRPTRTASLALLAIVTTVLVLEWGTYTYPAVSNYIGVFAHKCGLP